MSLAEVEDLLTHVLSVREKEGRSEGLHLIYSSRAATRYRRRHYAAAVQDAQTALACTEHGQVLELSAELVSTDA
jgi:hypothetical protein